MIPIDTWENCYDKGWKGILLDASMAHPAKYSRALISKIIAHALDEGWIQPGQTVLDPFSGVACGALPCLQSGLHWVGVELESKFVELGRENINLWNERYSGHFPRWGTAQVIQGDSRRLAEVVRESGLVVSSPPYANINPEKNGSGINLEKNYQVYKASGGGQSLEAYTATQLKHSQGYGSTDGQLSAMPPGDVQAVISSPPFAGNSGGRGEASRNGIEPGLFDRHSGGMKGGTGDDPANLDHLPMGTPPTAIISSPPYAESITNRSETTIEGDRKHRERIGRNPDSGGSLPMQEYGRSAGQLGAMVVGSPPFADSVGSDDPDKRGGLFRDEKRRNDTNLTGTYGSTDGQLGGMKAGVAVVGSPPFENSLESKDTNFQASARPGRTIQCADYGSTAGQIGATQGDTFWAAAKTIIDQCYQVLPPNAAAIWVLKMYIKDGKYVDFPGQWQQLCEACGFETIHEHRAMLVKNQGLQQTAMDGESVSKEISHKSFFRRLHERRRPDLAIDWETVLCTVRKPA